MTEWRTGKKKSAGKKSAKKSATKKAAANKTKETSAKKTAAKSSVAGKNEAAKSSVAGTKAAAKTSAVGKKAAAKKTAAKKTATKKAATKKTTTKKTSANKEPSANKKAANKRTWAKTSAAKKASAKKTAAKKTATKKASAKKASAKKPTTKKTSATASTKKSTGKKSSRKKASRNEPVRAMTIVSDDRSVADEGRRPRKAAGRAKASGKASAGKSSPRKASSHGSAGLRLLPPPAEPLPSNVLPLFPDFEPDHEWVMGLLSIPDPRVEGQVVIFVEGGTREILHLEALPIPSTEAVVGALHKAIARCEGRRRPPTRVRVALPEHAAILLEGRLEGITAVVGPTPELEGLDKGLDGYGLFDSMFAEEHDRYRGSAEITDELLMTFFEAAISFRRSMPWQTLPVDTPLAFLLPELGVEQGAVSAMGLGAEGGLVAVLDIDAIPDDVAPRGALGPEGLPPQSLAVVFGHRSEMSAARVDELETMPFAPQRGPHPVLLAVDGQQRSRAVTSSDYEVAIAAMLAVDAFASDYSPVLQCTSLRSLMACYPMTLGEHSRVDVYIGVPDVGWDDDDDDDAEDRGPHEPVIGPRPPVAASMVCRLKITLRGSQPSIWRKVEVPADITFAALHRVIQSVMGWDDYHLHEFVVGEDRLGPPSDDAFDRVDDERRVALGERVGQGDTFEYVYDFGDDWMHQIRVEKVYEPEAPLSRPRCTGGKRACPPEDSGGILGYEHALAQLSSQADDALPEELSAYEGFDPEAFDREVVDAALARLFGEP